MKIYILEKDSNLEIYEYIKKKHTITPNLKKANVVIVYKAFNVKEALDIIDEALMQGIEIICFKGTFKKEHYVTNYLIKNGAIYV